MSLYGSIKKSARILTPSSLREWIAQSAPKSYALVIKQLKKSARHDEIYDEHYFQDIVEPYIAKSADLISDSVIGEFHPQSVVDVGCGSGLLLDRLRSKGVAQCRGLEYAKGGLALCHRRNLEVLPFDLENETQIDWKADLAMSIEVAEHLPEAFADRFLGLLCSISKNVLLTAAQPGEGGPNDDHVNEQPRSYWIARMKTRGYAFDEALTEGWRKHWKENGASYSHWTNLMIFRSSDVANS